MSKQISLMAFVENSQKFVSDLFTKKYDIVIKREGINPKTKKWSNPIVFVRLNKKLSFTKQNKQSKKMSDSISIELTESFIDGLARYFSNQITNSDELKSKLELEKSVNEVSFL